jgi:hypothetical protein
MERPKCFPFCNVLATLCNQVRLHHEQGSAFLQKRTPTGFEWDCCCFFCICSVELMGKPSRPGVFFVGRLSIWIAIYLIFYRIITLFLVVSDLVNSAVLLLVLQIWLHLNVLISWLKVFLISSKFSKYRICHGVPFLFLYGFVYFPSQFLIFY